MFIWKNSGFGWVFFKQFGNKITNVHVNNDVYFVFTILVGFVKFFTIAFLTIHFYFWNGSSKKKVLKKKNSKKPQPLSEIKTKQNKKMIKRETNISHSQLLLFKINMVWVLPYNDQHF